MSPSDQLLINEADEIIKKYGEPRGVFLSYIFFC